MEELLEAKSQPTFSEIQEQLNITVAMMTSRLEKLAAQNKLERNVMRRNVVYRLKSKPLESSVS
jgi:DNA-binding HxlR family transcriptional regulator